MGPYITGELYVKTLAPMMGYYKQPEQTSSMIDNNGWIRTGEFALLQLSIVGTVKYTFNISGGSREEGWCEGGY